MSEALQVVQMRAQGGDRFSTQGCARALQRVRLELEPLLVVDDDGKVTSAAGDLAKAKVTASVVDQHRGKKIRVFTYKNKTRQSRTMGHRQSLTRLKVETIDLGARRRAARSGAKAKKEQDKQEEEG